ncbi:MAG: hypothetical protein ABGX04_10020 [Myxococcales bacterium]|nr:hypothetical protein [Myxococcales bacterium]HIM02633.1 hypothetical protein [Myxococcales bacterium]
MRFLLVMAAVAVTSLGCAAIQKSEAIRTERVLAAAGFQVKLADTPEKLARVKAMTQRKVQPHDKDGETYFVYADALECVCVYAGNQKAHQRYQRLALQQKLANQARQTAEMNQDAAMEWNEWGPWRPWY